MTHKFTLSILVFVFVVVGLIVYFVQDEIADNGRAYSSQATLCQHFAQSYLRTVQKTENITDLGSKKWQKAIDIETKIYNLCLADLNTE